MKVDFGARLTNLDGSVLLDTSPNGPVEATLGRAVVGALLSPTQSPDAMDKIRRVKLAQLAYEEKEVEVDDKDIAYIKEVVGQALQFPLVVSRCYELLEA